MLGRIHSTESFGAVDGPGTRFVIFTQGCPMRCQYCHNPDTWSVTEGTMRSVEDLIAEFNNAYEYVGMSRTLSCELRLALYVPQCTCVNYYKL